MFTLSRKPSLFLTLSGTIALIAGPVFAQELPAQVPVPTAPVVHAGIPKRTAVRRSPTTILPQQGSAVTEGPAVSGNGGSGAATGGKGAAAPERGPAKSSNTSHLRAALQYMLNAGQAMENDAAYEMPMGYLKKAYAELQAAASNPAYQGKKGEAMTLVDNAYGMLLRQELYAAPYRQLEQAATLVRFCIGTGK
jgi:hypothetical protein